MNDLFAPFYEGFYPWEVFYIDNFSQDMYDSGAYTIVGWFWVISCAALTLVYYYGLSNYGNWFKLRYWLLWILAISVVNFVAAYYISNGEMEDYYAPELSPYGFSEHFSFSMVNVLWAAVLSAVLSMIFKFKSVKASRTPF